MVPLMQSQKFQHQTKSMLIQSINPEAMKKSPIVGTCLLSKSSGGSPRPFSYKSPNGVFIFHCQSNITTNRSAFDPGRVHRRSMARFAQNYTSHIQECTLKHQRNSLQFDAKLIKEQNCSANSALIFMS